MLCGMDGRFGTDYITECRELNECHCGVEQTNLNERQEVGMRADCVNY